MGAHAHQSFATLLLESSPARSIAARVERVMHDLPAAELQVLRLRFGIGARRHTRREIARRLHISLTTVRRLERLALSDLRALALPNDVPRRRSRPGASVSRSGEIRSSCP